MTKSEENDWRKNSVICRYCKKECKGTAEYRIGDSVYLQCILTGIMWKEEEINGLDRNR